MLVVMGIFVYYVAPSAFLFQNYETFFAILNALLLVMIIGMTFIAMLLLPIFHKAFLYLFLCCCIRDRKLKRVVEKNLVSHKSRNTKTSMMMTITISFLVFAGTTFELMGSLLTSTIETAVGADIYAASTD